MNLRYLIHLLLLCVPPAEAAALFPMVKAEADSLCWFNREYRTHLRSLEELYFWREDIKQAIAETDHLYKAWGCLRDAKTETMSVDFRRAALFRLRGMIGVEAFERGEMPPHVPLWRFERIN